MKNKIFSLVLSFAVMFGVFGLINIQSANAQTATFPAGCSSALGYSVTTGNPCNGTSTATIGPLPGCSTALGYSVIDGKACSGGNVAISYLAGCSSIYGYSVITGMPCNGTSTPSVVYGGGSVGGTVGGGSAGTPGFPVTGIGGGIADSNIILLAISGLIVSMGFVYLTRKAHEY